MYGDICLVASFSLLKDTASYCLYLCQKDKIRDSEQWEMYYLSSRGETEAKAFHV